MNIEKTTIEDLRNYLINCIDKEGLIEGKRRFSLQLGILENSLFNEMDELYSSIYHLSDYTKSSSPEDAYLEELPVVDIKGNNLLKLTAVS